MNRHQIVDTNIPFALPIYTDIVKGKQQKAYFDYGSFFGLTPLLYNGGNNEKLEKLDKTCRMYRRLELVYRILCIVQ